MRSRRAALDFMKTEEILSEARKDAGVGNETKPSQTAMKRSTQWKLAVHGIIFCRLIVHIELFCIIRNRHVHAYKRHHLFALLVPTCTSFKIVYHQHSVPLPLLSFPTAFAIEICDDGFSPMIGH